LRIRPWLRFPANGIRVYTNFHLPPRVADSPIIEIPGEWNSRLHKRNLPPQVEVLSSFSSFFLLPDD
jgi:hypothetical protein